MGYELDAEQVRRLGDEIGRTGEDLRLVADQVAQVWVAATDFGGDRYLDYGKSYRDGNEALADLATQLATQVANVSVQLLDTVTDYEGTESTNAERLDSAGGGS